MSVSLLDVLSCGLAVVIILLVISLNTGTGHTNKEKITFVDITVYGDIDPPLAYDVSYSDNKKRCGTKPMGVGLFEIDLSDTVLDTLNHFFKSNIYSNENNSVSIAGHTFNFVKKFNFRFHPKCKGMEMEFLIEPYEEILIEITMTNISNKKNKSFTRTTKIKNVPMSIELNYQNGVRSIVRNNDTKSELINFFLKNVR